MPEVKQAELTPSAPFQSEGKRSGTLFLVIVIGVAVLFAILWGMAQKNYSEATKKLEDVDGRIAVADRARKAAEAQVESAKTANERVAAVQRDLDAARKEAANARAERDSLMKELAKVQKDAEGFQSQISVLETAAKAKDAGVPAPGGKEEKPGEPKKPGGGGQ